MGWAPKFNLEVLMFPKPLSQLAKHNSNNLSSPNSLLDKHIGNLAKLRALTTLPLRMKLTCDTPSCSRPAAKPPGKQNLEQPANLQPPIYAGNAEKPIKN